MVLMLLQPTNGFFIANAVFLRLETHQGKHDLESIFYILIYARTVFKGPRSLRVQQDCDLSRSTPSVLKRFDYKITRQSLKDVARLKLGHLAKFDDTILSKMVLYFNPLKPFLRSLVVAASPTRDYRYCQMSHETMIKLFNDQYHVLKRLVANQEKK